MRLLPALAAVVIALAFLAGFQSAPLHALKAAITPTAFPTFSPTPFPSPVVELPPSGFSLSLALPAASPDGQGALATFFVRAVNGSGKSFFEVSPQSPVANPEVQASLKVAEGVARQLAGNDGKDKDLYYSFSADSDSLGGNSAGAAAAVAMLAALKGQPLNAGALLTGSLSSEGKIGVVGEILPKARAAKAAGYSLLLVPPGERVQTEEREACKTETIGGQPYRTCTRQPVAVDVEAETGIRVVEVSRVLEAYGLMGK